MSKKRNQVLFSKPDDPKFLKLIKEQAGYKEGPNIDAKVCTTFAYVIKGGEDKRFYFF